MKKSKILPLILAATPSLATALDIDSLPEAKPRTYEPPPHAITSYVVDDRTEAERKETTSYKTSNFKNDSDKVLLARMLYGEARNCSESEKIAVAHTALNRVDDGKRWNGTTLKEVILKPWQYSCFNSNDPNLEKMKDPEKYDAKSFRESLEVAEEVLRGEHADPTRGATHYFNPKVVKPSWADKMEKIGKIGNSKHVFYKEK